MTRRVTWLLAVLAVAGVLAAGDEVARHLAAIEAWVAHLGPWAFPAFVLFFVVTTSLLVPETLLRVAAGALFGIGWGMAALSVGTLLAATLQYLLARHALRPRVQRALASRPALLAIQHAVLSDERRLQLLLRLAPVNPATISYLVGAAGVRFPGFLLALAALTPHLLVEVYFGHAGKHVARMWSAGRATVPQDIAIVAGVIAAIAGMVWLSKAARRALARAVAKVEEQPPDA